MNKRIIYEETITGDQWRPVTIGDIIKIPNTKSTDEVDILRKPKCSGGGEYLDEYIKITVKREMTQTESIRYDQYLELHEEFKGEQIRKY